MKPCIRNLKDFKQGCPENSSCPAWISTLGRLKPQPINKCVDIVIADLLWDLNCNTLGTQQATESFRNEVVKRHDAERRISLASQYLSGIATITVPENAPTRRIVNSK